MLQKLNLKLVASVIAIFVIMMFYLNTDHLAVMKSVVNEHFTHKKTHDIPPKFEATVNKTKISNSPLLQKQNTKLILFYHIKHWQSDFIGKSWMGAIFENCSQTNCLITRDRGLFEKSNVVIFCLDFAHRWNVSNLPTKIQNQIWIMSEFEAPGRQMENSLSVLAKCKREVNWTMGYRRDSDILLPHGRFNSFKSFHNLPKQTFASKTKDIVWFNSDCHTMSKREKFTAKLKKYLNVDIYGSCGTKKCTEGNRYKEAFGIYKNQNRRHCFDILDTDYKFYLSFENSICRDYITEKGTHHVMKHNIVPIMMSGTNHTLFNPPMSFIDTKEFESVKNLAKYLKYLLKNQTAYNEYLTWKTKYYPEGMLNMFKEKLCDICKRAHEPEKYHRIYNDLREWTFMNKLEGACKTPPKY